MEEEQTSEEEGEIEEEYTGSSGMTEMGERQPIEPVIGFENEQFRFLDRLSEDSSLDAMLNYIESTDLTGRAKRKLQIYVIALFDKEFAISRLENREDYMKLMDDKYIIDADLQLGLTRFDLTPEYHMFVDIVRLKFGIKLRRSMGSGFERKMIATTRSENISEERIRTKAPKAGTMQKIKGMLGD